MFTGLWKIKWINYEINEYKVKVQENLVVAQKSFQFRIIYEEFFLI